MKIEKIIYFFACERTFHYVNADVLALTHQSGKVVLLYISLICVAKITLVLYCF